MPNGRGTPHCCECKHHYFHRDPLASLTADSMCNFWKVQLPVGEKRDDNLEYLLPPEEYSCDNLICKDYVRKNEEVGWLLPDVVSQLEKGLLYAIGYPDISVPSAYHRIVCRLDKSGKNDTTNKDKIEKVWLDESVEDFVGKPLLVTNVLSNVDCGSFSRNVLFNVLCRNFVRDDPGAPLFSLRKKVGKRPFHICLFRFWDYRGKRYGGIAKIEEKRLWCNNFWVIFSIWRAGHFDFTDRIGKFIVRLGPEEPVFWNGKWPRFETGSPRFSGAAEIKAALD